MPGLLIKFMLNMLIFYMHGSLCDYVLIWDWYVENVIGYYATKPNHDESDSWMHMPGNICMLSFLPFIKKGSIFSIDNSWIK